MLPFVTRAKTIAALALLASFGTAQAGDWTNSANYNGYGATNQNTPSNFSLRDSNDNLAMVNGQIVSSNYSSNMGVQNAMAGGVGMSGAGAAYGQATAIGNSLNVTTVGYGNTVIIDSQQVNNGNQTASVGLNSH